MKKGMWMAFGFLLAASLGQAAPQGIRGTESPITKNLQRQAPRLSPATRPIEVN
jgi:hypothetical protein